MNLPMNTQTATLPAHLAGRQVRSLTERASEGMGGSLPPHVSLAGNSFTFVDAAGNEMAPMLTFDAVIVDISDRLNKRYYDKPYNPNETGEAPRCWSANGLTPSREVPIPVAPACEGCPNNVRGSAISKISGSAIKACRDEKWIAFIVPQLPQVVFQLVITPGSFKNWKAYTEAMRNHGVELSFALTRFSFVPKSTGELLFENVGWIDENTVNVVEAAVREGKTDAIVGRSDPVRQIAAPAAAEQQPQPAGFGQHAAPFENTPAAQPAAVQPAPTGFDQSPSPSAASTFQFPTANPAGGATTASPSEAPQRRRRRTAAEMATPAQGAVPATSGAPQAPFGQTAPQPAASGAPQAPFGQAAGTQFGMGQPAPVNAEMAAMLAGMGFQPKA